MSHKEIAGHLYEKLAVSGWWSQMIAVSYERDRGIREVHQTAGGYSVGVSRTFDVPVGRLYRHWMVAELRRGWLKEKFVIRRQTKNKSIRITWPNGKTSVEVYFTPKGRSKTQVSVQHSKLANSKQVEAARSLWKKALDRLSGGMKQNFVYISARTISIKNGSSCYSQIWRGGAPVPWKKSLHRDFG